jgi:transcriptional regulator with XRE-family HTH domain
MKATNLAEFKEKKGVTGRQLARLLGISESYLSEILSGKRSPSKKAARAISEKTGVPVMNLLFPGA